MKKKRELDKGLSALVLLTYAVIWLIGFIMSTSGANAGLVEAIGVVRVIIQIAVYMVLLYNAWGWSDKLIVRIAMLVITVWLVFCTIAPYIPGLDALKAFIS